MVVIDVKSDEEFLDHISEPGLAIVDFTAKWCQPCQAIKPTYERHSFLFRGMRFLKLDVDDVQNVASSAGVRSLPTFQIYKNGRKIDELVGADETELSDFIRKYNYHQA